MRVPARTCVRIVAIASSMPANAAGGVLLLGGQERPRALGVGEPAAHEHLGEGFADSQLMLERAQLRLRARRELEAADPSHAATLRVPLDGMGGRVPQPAARRCPWSGRVSRPSIGPFVGGPPTLGRAFAAEATPGAVDRRSGQAAAGRSPIGLFSAHPLEVDRGDPEQGAGHRIEHDAEVGRLFPRGSAGRRL